jgi:hypothetical protein
MIRSVVVRLRDGHGDTDCRRADHRPSREVVVVSIARTVAAVVAVVLPQLSPDLTARLALLTFDVPCSGGVPANRGARTLLEMCN